MPGFSHLLVVGESLGKPLLNLWQRTPHILLGYGPTECTIICTANGPLSEDFDPRVLGNAIACHHWIVDVRDPDRLAAVGAVGELIVEGPIVGREYIKAPGEKMAVFMTPGSWQPAGLEGHRAYRTGDLVRYIDAKGSIQFFGRKDTQVKSRGQRVKLSEIECHLRRLFVDAENVLADVMTPSVKPDPILVALVQRKSTSNSSRLLSPCQVLLSDWLQRIRPQMQVSLPPYMVPTLIIPLAHTPLTTTGKANRRKLRALVERLSIE